MWMSIHNAPETADRAASKLGSPPAHCPHPSECLRLPLRESRSFCEESDTRRMMLNRYRTADSKTADMDAIAVMLAGFTGRTDKAAQ